jgi:hypothetical protein
MQSCESRAQSKLHIGRRDFFCDGWAQRSRKCHFRATLRRRLVLVFREHSAASHGVWTSTSHDGYIHCAHNANASDMGSFSLPCRKKSAEDHVLTGHVTSTALRKCGMNCA